jgi:hypothetical protein
MDANLKRRSGEERESVGQILAIARETSAGHRLAGQRSPTFSVFSVLIMLLGMISIMENPGKVFMG